MKPDTLQVSDLPSEPGSEAWTAAMVIDESIEQFFRKLGLKRQEGHSGVITRIAQLAQLVIDRSCRDLENQLRKEWWLNHGCAGHPYGDDGEMQCCLIDFRRMAFNDLRKKVEEIRLGNNLRRAADLDPRESA